MHRLAADISTGLRHEQTAGVPRSCALVGNREGISGVLRYMSSITRPGRALATLLVLVALLMGACTDTSNTATPTPTATRTPVPASTLTPDPTFTLTPTPTSTLTPTPTANPTPTPTTSQPIGLAFDIRVGEIVALENSTWTLRFDAVTADSRCPVDVQCVWAGEVTARFTASPNAGPSVALEVTLGPNTDASSPLETLVLSLLEMNPAPKAGTPIAQGTYVATVVVERTAGQLGDSGIRGMVLMGPMCPVARPDQPCPDQPYEAVIVVKNATGEEVSRTTSAPDGRFSLDLPPGTYRIVPLSPPDSPFPFAGELTVTVSPAVWTMLDISYDTGIR